MIILGIDPGLATIGYGVIEDNLILGLKKQYRFMSAGIISTDKNLSLEERLDIIFSDISSLIDKYNPDLIAIEELFFAKNTKTAMLVSQARGVILLACIKSSAIIRNYTPLQIKLALTSDGRASKKQIQQMVKTILSLPDIPRPDDAADGLALALVGARSVMGLDNKNHR